MFKDGLLKGKRILITGLGKEIAAKYLQLGAEHWERMRSMIKAQNEKDRAGRSA